jgi:hypothetical protein
MLYFFDIYLLVIIILNIVHNEKNILLILVSIGEIIIEIIKNH